MIGARALTVVAILLALVGMLAYYVAHTALDDAGFETIARNMIESDAIRTQVALTAVDRLYTNVDVEAAIADRLPPAQKGLAPVLAGLSRSGADRAAEAALERPRVQQVWVDVDDGDAAPTGAAAGRQDEVPERRREGRSRSSSDHHPDRRPGGRDRTGGREAARLGREDHCHRREPTGDRPDDHEDPAHGRQLDVAHRTRCRGTRYLARPGASQARAARARDRRARRWAADAGRAPRRGRLSRRPTLQGRQRQAGGTRRVGHPDADPRRPRLGVDHPRCRDTRRSLVRR